MSQVVAILTGDLIGSTQASPKAVDNTMAIIRKCAATLGSQTDFTRFRGDGWQIRLVRPGDCLWACLLILARLKADESALGCRIAVGIGAEYPTDARDLSTAMGPAFTASGRALDQMKPDRILALDGPHPAIDRFRKLTFTVAAELAGRWTTGQAEAMALKLDPDSPADERQSNEAIARRLGVTRQAIDARLKSADYALLEEMIQAFLAEDFSARALHD
ncbi:hypothetical protein [Tabrizicola sp.]|uniref:hypothetical protein n=1 Tax=Tabrizicola sp. TaxID=2005166 RepID=UPI002FDD7663